MGQGDGVQPAGAVAQLVAGELGAHVGERVAVVRRGGLQHAVQVVDAVVERLVVGAGQAEAEPGAQVIEIGIVENNDLGVRRVRANVGERCIELTRQGGIYVFLTRGDGALARARGLQHAGFHGRGKARVVAADGNADQGGRRAQRRELAADDVACLGARARGERERRGRVGLRPQGGIRVGALRRRIRWCCLRRLPRSRSRRERRNGLPRRPGRGFPVRALRRRARGLAR